MTDAILIQTVYDYAKTMLEPSIDEFQNCAYRGTDGNMCLIGSLIPDDVYTPAMDSVGGIIGLMEFFSNELEPYLGTNYLLLDELQMCHDIHVQDDLENWEWKKCMLNDIAVLARHHNVKLMM